VVVGPGARPVVGSGVDGIGRLAVAVGVVAVPDGCDMIEPTAVQPPSAINNQPRNVIL
jgi:hypothetical protein